MNYLNKTREITKVSHIKISSPHSCSNLASGLFIALYCHKDFKGVLQVLQEGITNGKTKYYGIFNDSSSLSEQMDVFLFVVKRKWPRTEVKFLFFAMSCYSGAKTTPMLCLAMHKLHKLIQK